MAVHAGKKSLVSKDIWPLKSSVFSIAQGYSIRSGAASTIWFTTPVQVSMSVKLYGCNGYRTLRKNKKITK